MNTRPPAQLKILLIGDDCLDVYQYGTVDRISPEAPVPVFKISHEVSKQGMAGNVYNNLVALGCTVNYLHGNTSKKTRLIDMRSKQQIVRIDEDVVSTPIMFETAIPTVYDAIVISDYDKGTISYEVVEEIIAGTNCPVFIDTKKKDLARFKGATIKINLKEFNEATSHPPLINLIVTQGAEGARWNEQTFSAEAVEVSDVTGAGDTFLAGLVYEYLIQRYMQAAIKFAIKSSSITVQHLGVYAPVLDEIL